MAPYKSRLRSAPRWKVPKTQTRLRATWAVHELSGAQGGEGAFIQRTFGSAYHTTTHPGTPSDAPPTTSCPNTIKQNFPSNYTYSNQGNVTHQWPATRPPKLETISISPVGSKYRIQISKVSELDSLILVSHAAKMSPELPALPTPAKRC